MSTMCTVEEKAVTRGYSKSRACLATSDPRSGADRRGSFTTAPSERLPQEVNLPPDVDPQHQEMSTMCTVEEKAVTRGYSKSRACLGTSDPRSGADRRRSFTTAPSERERVQQLWQDIMEVCNRISSLTNELYWSNKNKHQKKKILKKIGDSEYELGKLAHEYFTKLNGPSPPTPPCPKPRGGSPPPWSPPVDGFVKDKFGAARGATPPWSSSAGGSMAGATGGPPGLSPISGAGAAAGSPDSGSTNSDSDLLTPTRTRTLDPADSGSTNSDSDSDSGSGAGSGSG